MPIIAFFVVITVVTTAKAVEEGVFLLPNWFRKNGIPAEITFDYCDETPGWVCSWGFAFFGLDHYDHVEKLHAVGIHPVTGQEQRFTTLCPHKDWERFRSGDKLTVYVRAVAFSGRNTIRTRHPQGDTLFEL